MSFEDGVKETVAWFMLKMSEDASKEDSEDSED